MAGQLFILEVLDGVEFWTFQGLGLSLADLDSSLVLEVGS